MIRRALAAMMMLAASVYAASETQPATQPATAPHPVELLKSFPASRVPKDGVWSSDDKAALVAWLQENAVGKPIDAWGQVTAAEGATSVELRVLSTHRKAIGGVMMCRMVITTRDASALNVTPGQTLHVRGTIGSVGCNPPTKDVPGVMFVGIRAPEYTAGTMPAADIALCRAEGRVVVGMSMKDALTAMGTPTKTAVISAKEKTTSATWVLNPEAKPALKATYPMAEKIEATVADGLVKSVEITLRK